MKKKKKKEIDKRPRIFLAYIGIFEGKNFKKLTGWLKVTDKDIKESEYILEPDLEDGFIVLSYSTKSKVWASVGEIYEFPTDDSGNSFYVGEGKHIGNWKNKKCIAHWDAMSTARESYLNSKAKMKSIGRNRPLNEYLEPIKTAYQRLTGSHKAQLLAQVVKIITSR